MASKWGFIGAAYADDSPNVAAQRCVNLYPETVQVGGEKNVISLKSSPGLRTFGTLPTSPVKGQFSVDAHTFAVGGTNLYQMLPNGTSLSRGVMATNHNPCTFATNGDGGNQLLTSSGGNAYVLDFTSNTFSQAHFTSGLTDYVPSDFVGFVDGFGLTLDVVNNKFYVSAPEDFTYWDATQVRKRSSNADRWSSMIVNHSEVWLFGSQTTDVLRDTGASPMPFEPIVGTSINQGILASHSAAVWNNGVIWLGANASGAGRVWFASAYQPQEVSTVALNQQIAGYATVSDAVGYVEVWKGHEFYILNFPTQGKTWVLDASTSLWHERGWWNTTTGQFDGYRGQSQCYAFGQQLVGDGTTGTIYALDDTVYTDAGGTPLVRLRQCPHVSSEQRWMFHQMLQIDAEVGLGLNSGQGSDPQLMLQWSDDGGHSWGNEHWLPLGPQGQYRVRALIRRLGRSRDRVYRVVVSDPIPLRFVDAYLTVEGGTS